LPARIRDRPRAQFVQRANRLRGWVA
jgi:hypothetical protein